VIRNNGKNNRSAKNHHNVTIIDGKSADIETIDNTISMETVGVAIGKLRESLDKVESHLFRYFNAVLLALFQAATIPIESCYSFYAHVS
jgi:hypothetical protein